MITILSPLVGPEKIEGIEERIVNYLIVRHNPNGKLSEKLYKQVGISVTVTDDVRKD